MPVRAKRDQRDDLFTYIWEALAEAGACDAVGSEEYRRVFGHWIADGRPVGIAETIIYYANLTPAPDPAA